MAATALKTIKVFFLPIESAILPVMGAATAIATQKETIDILRR